MERSDQQLEQLRSQIHSLINHYFDEKPIPVKPEIFTRTKFVAKRGKELLNTLKGIQNTGNILSSIYTKKFIKCVKINDHYNNEFRKHLNF